MLTSIRFHRRPSRFPGQPFRLASKDPLPGAKDFGKAPGWARSKSSVEPSSEPLVTATTTASLSGASHVTLRVGFRFRRASAKIAYGKPLILVPDRRPLRCVCAAGPVSWPSLWAGVALDEHTGRDVYRVYKCQYPPDDFLSRLGSGLWQLFDQPSRVW
jgi:hypothetical protein